MNLNKRSICRRLAPHDFNGEAVLLDQAFLKQKEKVDRVASKRVQRLALECARMNDPVSIQDALIAAYIQGMHDAVNLYK